MTGTEAGLSATHTAKGRLQRELRDRLDALMPEPLADVLERQESQRTQLAAQLRRGTTWRARPAAAQQTSSR